MEKKRIALLAYGIPWVFLILCGDVECGWAWQYLLIPAGMALAGWIGAGTGGVLLAGNGISLGLSLLCIHLAGFTAQDHYFKPFGAFGWAAVLAVCSLLLQWLVWKREWKVLMLLTAAVGSLTGLLYWLQFTV